MNVFGQLKKACLEILSAQPSSSTQGRVWYNSTTGKNEFDNGTQKRALLANDDKAIIGNSGTAGFNIRFHRAANGLLQYVLGSDVTAEGTRSTNLAEISGKMENYTDAGKPTFGNAGRLAYLNDLAQLSLDIGTSWKYLADTNTAQTLTNKTINASNNTISNITNAMVNSGSATSGQALTANGLGGAAWVTPGASENVTTTTANYSVLSSDQTIKATSSSHTLTLPLGSGLVTGQKFRFIHFGTSLTSVYSIAASGGDTIGPNALTTIKMHTKGQVVTLQWDGSTFQIIESKTSTGWVDAGANVITATTTSPTKSSGLLGDKVYWRRVGKNAEIRIEYIQSSTTGAANGSGDYLFRIPANMTIDADTINEFSTPIGSNSAASLENVVGFGDWRVSNSNQKISAIVYDTTRVRFYYLSVSSGGMVDSTTGSGLATANFTLVASMSIPILDWLE